MQIYLLTSAVIFIASMIAGLAGFGAMIISVPLLTMFLDIKTVVPLTILASLSIHSLILIQMRRHFEFHKIQPLLIGALPGIVIGVALLKYSNKEILQIILWLTILFNNKRSHLSENYIGILNFHGRIIDFPIHLLTFYQNFGEVSFKPSIICIAADASYKQLITKSATSAGQKDGE